MRSSEKLYSNATRGFHRWSLLSVPCRKLGPPGPATKKLYARENV
jgi:hypothetical protein